MLKFIPLLLLILKLFYGQMGHTIFISVACYSWIFYLIASIIDFYYMI